ncbi:MAG: O-antigen ligase family protein [Sphingobium sp.]
MSSRGITSRAKTAPVLIALLLLYEQMALGSNGHLLASIAAVAEIGVALLVLILLQPDGEFFRRAWPVTGLSIAALAWLMLPSLAPGLIANAPPRPAPDLVLPGLARQLGGLALLLAGGWIGYRRGLLRIGVRAIVLSGLLCLVVGMIFRQYSPDQVWGFSTGILGGRNTGTLLNANSAGCLAGMTALLALGILLENLRSEIGRRNSPLSLAMRALMLIVIILSLAAVASSGSRTVLALTIILLMATSVADDLLWRLMFSWSGLVYMALGIVVMAILATTTGEITLSRIMSLQTDGISRTRLWDIYWTMAKASPWTGYGPLSLDAISAERVRDISAARATWYVHSPHSTPLSLLLTGGLPYLALLCAAAATMLATIAKAARFRRQDPLIRTSLAALILLLLCSLVDIQMDVPALGALAIALTAMLWGRSLRALSDRDARACASRSD